MFNVEGLLQASLLSDQTFGSMASRRKLIEWSPRDSSHFIVAASDLRLYQVPEKADNEGPIPSKDGIRVLSVNSEIQNIKCLSWAPFKKESDLNNIGEVAVGLLSGRVVLTSLSDGVPRLLKEFVPQHARACNAVSWNSHNNYLLAAGLDKVRHFHHKPLRVTMEDLIGSEFRCGTIVPC